MATRPPFRHSANPEPWVSVMPVSCRNPHIVFIGAYFAQHRGRQRSTKDLAEPPPCAESLRQRALTGGDRSRLGREIDHHQRHHAARSDGSTNCAD